MGEFWIVKQDHLKTCKQQNVAPDLLLEKEVT